MTDTTNTVENNDAETTGAQPQPPRGEIAHLHPATLRLGENVRDSVDLGKDFLASVRQHGVLVPITAVRTDDGVVTVRNGARRTLAAREVGLPTVPVYVLPADSPDDSAEAVARIVHQIVTNDHKADRRPACPGHPADDRGGPVHIQCGQKALGKPRDLKAAEAAGRSPAAMDALASGQLSLAEAATLSDFDGDDEAIAELVDVAGTDRFAHYAARLRKDRERKQAALAAAQPYAERGFTVLLDEPSWRSLDHIALDRLWTLDGREAGEQHVTNPAHWAVVPYEEDVYIDAQGDIVDADNIDWSTRGRPEATPEDGHLHADAVSWETRWVIDYYCTIRRPQA
jgi:ParB family transcriptional regulator, chromosome partitioning protein